MAWNDGKALTKDEVQIANNWLTNEAKGDKNLLNQKATEFGLDNNQRQQLGLAAQAYGDGRGLTESEKQNARTWATGKTAQEIQAGATSIGATPEQLGQIFGWTGADSTAGGYGTAAGIKPEYLGLKFDGTTWTKPSDQTAPTGMAAQAGYTPVAAAPPATVTQATVTPATVTRAAYTPAQYVSASVTPWNVTPEQTVRHQAEQIVHSDSPLMQSARGAAMQAANGRGLVNSSLAIGSAQDAVIGRALDIARPDAAMYGSAAQFNANAGNTNSMFNAGQQNQVGMFNAGQQNQVGMFNAESDNSASQFNAGASNSASQFNAGASNTASMFNTGQANEVGMFNTGQKNSVGMFNTGQTNTYNIADRELTQKESQFSRTLTQQQEQFAENAAMELRKMGIQVDLAKMDDGTRRYLAELGASTAGVAAGISASAQMAIADANRIFNSAENKTNAFNRQWENYTDRVLKITVDPSLDQPTKDKLITSETNGFKGWAQVNQIVGDLTFVDSYGGTNQAAPAPAPAAPTGLVGQAWNSEQFG